MNLINGLIGLILLAAGRRLFWLFIASVGFAAGLQIAPLWFGAQPAWVAWGVALLFGLAGDLLGLFFQGVAIVLGGFAAGSTITVYIAAMLGFAATPVISLAGGVVGAIVLYALFDWALIVLSSFVGATLVVQSLNWNSQIELILYVILIAVGILIQAVTWRQHKSGTE